MDLPFEEIGEVKVTKITQKHIDLYYSFQKQYSYPNNSKENLEKRDRTLEKMGVTILQMIGLDNWRKKTEPTTLISLPIWPGEGCETCDLDFEKQGKKSIWKCQSFCKTQYADNFMRCHLLVIRFLDELVKEGFKVDVSDEGEYWNTRDLKVLAKEINMSTEMIAGLSEVLKKTFGENNIEANIDNCKNIINIKES